MTAAEESVGAGKNTLHRAVSLRLYGSDFSSRPLSFWDDAKTSKPL